MAHLSSDLFIDLLDATVAESDVPHLASCQVCRLRLKELRETCTAATDLDMPEPSPLFWDHLSTRVRDAVAREDVPRPSFWRIGWSWRGAGVATAAAALAVAVSLQVNRSGIVDVGGTQPVVTGTMIESQLAEPLAPLPEDESLWFVADLASHLDWDAVSETGLATGGGAERVVADMNEGERAELQRLLSEALGGGV